jgi:hypothetical protein
MSGTLDPAADWETDAGGCSLEALIVDLALVGRERLTDPVIPLLMLRLDEA